MNAIYGDALRQYREERDLSLRDVAQMLGVSSPSTVKSWEDGQDIPGPVQLLLRMLIHGELPFA
jgi:transcriptional regulator with XRE-family HTH domain